MERARIKETARDAIGQNNPSIIVIFIIYLIISAIVSSLTKFMAFNLFFAIITSVCSFLFSIILEDGFSYCCLKAYSYRNPEYKDLFYCINYIGKFVGATLVVTIYTLLWSLLLIVPGIIKAYSYRQTFYILLENPDMSIGDAITRSTELMENHKMELFIFDLSFILWGLLCVITIGIASIYVIPYTTIANAGYYKELKTRI